MRWAMIVLILIVAGVLINAIHGDDGFPLPQVFPWMGGTDRPLIYNLGGCALLLITGWGLCRLYRKSE